MESDFGIHLSIWSLLSGTSQLIMGPKSIQYNNSQSQQLIAFSNCSKYVINNSKLIFDTIL